MSKGELLSWIKVNPSLELLGPELRALTAAEYGAHTRLRYQYWVGGCQSLPEDDRVLATAAGCDGETWAQVKPAIMRLWSRKNRRLYHVKTRLEWQTANHLHESRKNSARARHGKGTDINGLETFADAKAMQKGTRTYERTDERTDGDERTDEDGRTNPRARERSGAADAPPKADVRPIRPTDDGRRGDDIAGRLANLVAALRQVGVPIADADAGMVERFAKAATEGTASIDGWVAERIAARKDSFVPSLCKARNVWGLMVTDFERWQKGAA